LQVRGFPQGRNLSNGFGFASLSTIAHLHFNNMTLINVFDYHILNAMKGCTFLFNVLNERKVVVGNWARHLEGNYAYLLNDRGLNTSKPRNGVHLTPLWSAWLKSASLNVMEKPEHG
jgi:hypothetical protein